MRIRNLRYQQIWHNRSLQMWGLLKVLWLLFNVLFLLPKLFKLVLKFYLSFIKFHRVSLLCLLYCNLWLNQKLPHLSSDRHSLYLTLRVNNNNLWYPILSVVIEKYLSNGVLHWSLMKKFTSSMLSSLYVSTSETHNHNKLAIDIEIATDNGSNFILTLLSPQPLFTVINSVCSVL